MHPRLALAMMTAATLATVCWLWPWSGTLAGAGTGSTHKPRSANSIVYIDLKRFKYATLKIFTVGGEGLVVDIFVVHTSVIESGFPGVVHVAREFRAAVTKSVTKYENWMRPM